jgi:hypothetical protein
MKEAENVGKELVCEESEEKNDVALPTSDDVSENEIGKSSVEVTVESAVGNVTEHVLDTIEASDEADHNIDKKKEEPSQRSPIVTVYSTAVLGNSNSTE